MALGERACRSKALQELTIVLEEWQHAIQYSCDADIKRFLSDPGHEFRDAVLLTASKGEDLVRLFAERRPGHGVLGRSDRPRAYLIPYLTTSLDRY